MRSPPFYGSLSDRNEFERAEVPLGLSSAMSRVTQAVSDRVLLTFTP